MDSNRKKELKNIYMNTKSNMGIVVFECISNNNKYIGCVKDCTLKVNSLKAMLNANIFRGRRNLSLQLDWNEYGEDNFKVNIIDELEYDTTLSEEENMENLKMLLEENMKKDEYKEVIE